MGDTVRIIATGHVAEVLEKKKRRRNGRGKEPRFDYRLGVQLPTGAMHSIGWYYDTEIEVTARDTPDG